MTLRRKIAVFGFVSFSFLTLFLLGHSEIFKTNSSQLSNLITADVLLTIPFIYFLLIRKTEIPKFTIIPVTIIGVVLASFIIPEGQQQTLELFKTWILPILEIFIIGFILFKVIKTIKTFKANREIDSDFYSILKNSCEANFPSFVANALATEIGVFYYGLIYWKKRRLETNEFSYHKKSGSLSLFLAFVLILAAESVGVHYMLRQSENQVGLWIITILSLYTAFQVLGFAKSILKRPIKISETELLLRYGIMKNASISLKNVLAVEITGRDIDKDKRIKRLSLLGGLESHNFILHFEREIKLTGLYGIKQKAKSLALSIDKPEEFKMALKEAKQSLIAKETNHSSLNTLHKSLPIT